MTDEGWDFEGDVAEFDQYHAQAIDRLRDAETFILAVPDEIIEEDAHGGIMRIAIMGGGEHFEPFRLAVAHGMARATEADEIDLQAWLRRDRWIRGAMVAAIALNLILVGLNLATLL